MNFAGTDFARIAPMRVVALLNERARVGDSGASCPTLEEVSATFREAGVDAIVQCVDGAALGTAAREAIKQNVDAVVAGGGDGTINAVAAALAGGNTPLGVLPLGTLNHFAKDNGLPLDLAGAVEVIARGRVARLDVGRVNDRIFINNSSLGVYARALVERDRRRDHLGTGKWVAMMLAAFKVFRRSPLLRVHLATDDEGFSLKTPLVLVGNNHYQLDLFRVGTRACLDQGVLSLYVANTTSRWGMLKLGFRAALGRLQQSRDFETRCVESVRVATRRSRVHVALDGEVTTLATPLDYSIWPRALPVLLPP